MHEEIKDLKNEQENLEKELLNLKEQQDIKQKIRKLKKQKRKLRWGF